MAKRTKPLKILAGDIGGTKTQLGLFSVSNKRLCLISEKHMTLALTSLWQRLLWLDALSWQ